MSVGFKRVINTAPRSVAIVFKGQQVNLPPGEQEVDGDLADAFVENSPHVYPAKDAIGSIFESNQVLDDRVYLANMTGNPEAPPTVKTKSFIDKRWQQVEIENPNYQARDLKKTMQGPMVEYIAKDGVPEALNTFPYDLKIPKYMRVHFPKHIADWWMRREHNRPRENQGETIISRPPSDFEPNMNWPLEDMNLYLKFMDPDAAPLDSEAEAIKKATVKLGAEYRKLKNRPSIKGSDKDLKKYVETHLKKELYLAKKEAMKRLFFRLVDPQFVLPTREQFEALKRGENPVEDRVDENQVNMVLDALQNSESTLAEDSP